MRIPTRRRGAFQIAILLASVVDEAAINVVFPHSHGLSNVGSSHTSHMKLPVTEDATTIHPAVTDSLD